MSVPKSNVLSCSRSFLAKTDLGYCSPKQSQNVNVVVSPQMCHYDATPNPYDVQAGEEELRKAKPDFILNEAPFSSSPFLFKGLRFERSLLGGKVPC